MRIVQNGIFVGDLHKKGFDVETCSKFQMGPNLINDGAGGGKKETNPLHPSVITENDSLILFAKNAETMKRGLAKIDQTQIITGNGCGLCIVAGYHSKPVMGGAKKVGQFLQWSVERGKQGFIHDSYNIAQFFAAISKATVLKNNSNRQYIYDKVNTTYARLGMRGKVTFADFKSIVNPKLKDNFAMIMVCLNKSMPLHKPEGVTVIRNIRTRMTAGELSSLATQAFAGQGENPFMNPFNGTMQTHNDIGSI
ncbi:hypothetical protein LJR030_000764 [Rhizobium sp. LjRoot30]|uniref:hypothetical protein n=1 Tax=Rhizobium sp. LjRoot30 TaxID=3342320 RepID=UPI003ECF43D8